MNKAIWRKLGRKPYIKHEIRTHTNGHTGFYRLQVLTDKRTAERFLREHPKCVAVGAFYCRNRKAMAEQLRKQLNVRAAHAQHGGVYRQTRRSGDLVQDQVSPRGG